MMFFPPKAAPDIMRGMEAQAKTVCESCPVQAECLEEALARPEEWGVWGGMTAGERQRLRRRRQRLRRLGRLDGMD